MPKTGPLVPFLQKNALDVKLVLTRPSIMFTEVPDAVAVRKGQNAGLLTQLNAGIAAIRTDGTWQKINDQWMGC